MKEITMYETDDGQVFRSEPIARYHEDALKYYKKFKVTVTLTRYLKRSTRLASTDALILEIKEAMDNEYNGKNIGSCDVKVEVLNDD